MGYYSWYSLSLYDKEHKNELCLKVQEPIISELIESNEEAETALSSTGESIDETKWYGAVEDLQEFSLKYPDILFELTVMGEEVDDRWIAYVLNGKSQIEEGILTYKPFSSTKLKTYKRNIKPL